MILMLLDIGWTELVLIAVVAIVVIGPKDLPVVLRTLGRMARRARVLMNEFKGSVDEMIRESEIEEARRTIDTTTAMTAKPREIAKPDVAAPTPPPAEAPQSGDDKPKA